MKSLTFLLRQRAFVGLGVSTLIAAVGANLVVFSIVNALWLRPRPITDPSGVVMILGDASSGGSAEGMVFAEAGLQRLRGIPAVTLVAGQVMTSGRNAGLRPRLALADAGLVETLGVTAEYFSVLGLSILGRDFVRDDDRYGAAPVAIISDRLWKRAFEGRSDIIGATVPASPMPVQIVGVAPAGFEGARLGEHTDLWIPRNLIPRVSFVPALRDGSPGIPEGVASVLPIARLAPSVTPADAQRLITEQYPRGPGDRTQLVVVPIASVFGSPVHRTLLINEGPVLRVVAMTAFLVLVGGCMTLLALVLVYYERRRDELAIRLALGASRPRLLGQLATELAWLVALGSAGAFLVAAWAVDTLPALSLPGGVNLGLIDLSLDWPVAVVGIGLALLTLGLAACLPLLRFTRSGLVTSLVSAVATPTAGSLRVRKIILGTQVCATVIVLVSASLFVRTIQHAFDRGAGFDLARTLFVSVDLGTFYDLSVAMAEERRAGRSPTSLAERQAEVKFLTAIFEGRRRVLAERLMAAVATVPGIHGTALGEPPIGPDQALGIAQPKAVETDGERRSIRLALTSIGPAYLDILGVRVVEGRGLTKSDAVSGGPRPALVTSSLAAVLWPGQSPLGRRVRTGYGAPGLDHEIVGVTSDFAFGSMRLDPPAVLMTAAPDGALSANTLRFAVRSENHSGVVEPLRRVVTEMVPDSPRILIESGRDIVATDLGRERLAAWFFTGFGIIATILGIGGVFGLIAYLAESRRREFGIRLALGATSQDVLWHVLMAGLVPAMIGAGVGLVGAVWLAGTAESLLVGVTRLDAVSYAGAFILILTGAVGAGLAAGWRVFRLSPMDALRTW